MSSSAVPTISVSQVIEYCSSRNTEEWIDFISPILSYIIKPLGQPIELFNKSRRCYGSLQATRLDPSLRNSVKLGVNLIDLAAVVTRHPIGTLCVTTYDVLESVESLIARKEISLETAEICLRILEDMMILTLVFLQIPALPTALLMIRITRTVYGVRKAWEQENYFKVMTGSMRLVGPPCLYFKQWVGKTIRRHLHKILSTSIHNFI